MLRRETILAADIGGTNTRFLLHEIKISEDNIDLIESIETLKVGDSLLGQLILSKKYLNQDYSSFLSVLQQFLEDASVTQPPLTACFAVAGPVKDNVVRFTNRVSWSIDGDEVETVMGIKHVQLINDFLAAGYGVLTLDEPTECVKLQDAPKLLDAPIAVIGAGTGLGECFLTPGREGIYQCFPSEGGHAEFAPRNKLEVGLLKFLKTKFSQKHRVSVERSVSGSGLPNIYEYLSEAMPDSVDPAIDAEIAAAGDLKGGVIAKHRLQNPICEKAMEIFITAYGAEAGVAALKWLPYGGLYITGGLTPKNIDLIKDEDGAFMTAYLDKGRVSGLLCSIPLYAVMVENLGERGALLNAFKLLQQDIRDSQQQLNAEALMQQQQMLMLEQEEMMMMDSGYSQMDGSMSTGALPAVRRGSVSNARLNVMAAAGLLGGEVGGVAGGVGAGRQRGLSNASSTRSKSFFRSRNNNSTLSLANANLSNNVLYPRSGGSVAMGGGGSVSGRIRGYSNASKYDRASLMGESVREESIGAGGAGGDDSGFSFAPHPAELKSIPVTNTKQGYLSSVWNATGSVFRGDSGRLPGLSSLKDRLSPSEKARREVEEGSADKGGGKTLEEYLGDGAAFGLTHLLLASLFTGVGFIMAVAVLRKQ